ncbi:zinc finger E-box-binding homeobox 2 isoform 2-T2 [Menidia menidia]
MSEESRGKRRKQANPKRNRVDAEQLSSLGSEEEDEVGLWSLEPQDCHESLDKTSLTPSEGTEESGSPAHSSQQRCLSPGARDCWGQVESGAKAEEDSTYPSADREGDQGPRRMYCKNLDSHNGLEDFAHFEVVAQLRKDSTPVSILNHLNHNGTSAAFHPSGRHDELPPAIWSPGAQRCSPEGADADRCQQACPFCHRMYERGASLRDHVKYCQEREGGHMVCPLCGYITPLRSQMERHLALHNQIQDKSGITLEQGMETRKFKCLQCGKAFKYKHHLKEHLRIHSGEKPYECSNCKKRFSHSGSYSSHLSSKKCLSGGGNIGGNAGATSGTFNGHSQSSYNHSYPTSPSAGGGGCSNDKSSAPASHSQDSAVPFGRHPADPHQVSLQDFNSSTGGFPGVSELARLWDPAQEISRTASFLKGTTLLPYLHSGTKFEQMLQDMLHRDVKRDEEIVKGDEEERRLAHNGGGFEKNAPLDSRREAVASGEVDRGVLGMTCRWCSQLFPNVAVLLQHERYLCKMNREAMEVPEGVRGKDHSSLPLFYPMSAIQPEKVKPNEVTNGLSGKKSPLQKPNWLSVPQKLMVAMQSPPAHHEAMSSRMYWPSQEKGSPGQLIHQSPEPSSLRGRRRVPSSGFGSPPPSCFELTGCPPEISSPTRDPGSPWSAQSEPLDLSMPKALSEQRGRNRTPNGILSRGERREFRTQHLRRPSPTTHLPLHQHPVFSGTRAAVFPASLYNGFPIFGQSGVGLSMHNGITPAPFSPTANSPVFPSPVAFMMETDADVAMKNIYQDRQGLMGEGFSRSALDYLTLIDDGFEGEGGSGRKRLRKTDEGLYACDICEKTFQKSSSLLRHKYEHTGKRPHECKICNKAFKHKHHLIEHSRLHSGEKPYQCDKCGKRFSHSGSYSQHMNHRYAYCSKDQDPDQDQEEMPLTLSADSNLVGCSDNTPLSMDDMQTAHSFLSDSSLDGAPDTLKEEDEEERVSGAQMSLSKEEDELIDGLTQESPAGENGVPNAKHSYDLGNHIDDTDNNLWDRKAEDQSKDLDKCELSLDLTELPRIKT